MTFSIVARDPETGDLAVAVQSKFLAVGSVVPWARAGAGAVATQAFANVRYGPDGLDLLASGATAGETLERLVRADAGREHRQLGIVDARGGAASHTGRACFAWAGGRTAENVAAQGNILAGAAVVDALFETFRAGVGSGPGSGGAAASTGAGGGSFVELLVRCLAEADRAGGDRRGRESAALLVVRPDGAYGGGGDRWIDLRVDDHPDPIGELGRLLGLWSLYFRRPEPGDLVALDAALAADVRRRLDGAGYVPGRSGGVFAPMWPEEAAAAEAAPGTPVGEPRPFPDGWDADWQAALTDWMSVENLEERAVAPGWLDRRVVAYMREHLES